MEIAGLAVMALVVAVSAMAVVLGRCSSGKDVSRCATDSIVAEIESRQTALIDSAEAGKKRSAIKAASKSKQKTVRQPRERDYLDETVENPNR